MPKRILEWSRGRFKKRFEIAVRLVDFRLEYSYVIG
jgi:hypothetical protein